MNVKTSKHFILLAVSVSVLATGAALAGSQLSPDAPANLGVTPRAAALPVLNTPAEVLILRGIEKELKEKLKKDVFRPSNIPSLVFTPSQHALLNEARLGFNTRVPTAKELDPTNMPSPDDPNYRAPSAVRKLSLGGIVFNTPDEWTIYLNSKRITPDALPTEAVDLRVYKDFIELRWFDAQTNQIFPIRLRPNQTFNLDARVFLPG